MLPSPMYLKLYLEIANLDWDSFVFQTDGKSNPGDFLRAQFPAFMLNLAHFEPLLLQILSVSQAQASEQIFQPFLFTLSVHGTSLRFERCVPFFLCSGINLCKAKEVCVEYGNRSHKIDANLLKIHHWPGFNMAKCWCKWGGEKSTLSLQINRSCRLQLINTTACQESCFITFDGNYCIYLFHPNR